MNPISAVMIVKNGERYLREALEALAPVHEVVVYDNGSTDATRSIAASFANVRIVQGEFLGFGKTKQAAIAHAHNDWIFCIDADEIASPELVDAILRMPLELECAYSFAFHNFYRGRHIHCCGWYPDRQLCLFHRAWANFDDSEVHEKIVALPGKALQEIALPHHLRHYPYSGAEEFLEKMQRYSTLFARQNAGKKSSSLFKALTRGAWAFIKKYLLQRGILEGYAGFLISAYNAQSTFWKYIKLKEANEAIR